MAKKDDKQVVTPIMPQVDAPRIDSSFTEEPNDVEPELKRTTRIKNYAYEKTPEKLKNANDLQIRFRTALVYTLLTLIGLFAGNIVCMVMLSITAGICAGEFYFMLRKDAKLPNEVLGIIGAVLYPIAFYFWGLAGACVITLLLLVALIVWYVFYMRARIADVCVSFFGAVYTGGLLGSLMLIRPAIGGLWGGFVLFVMIGSIWANDAAAYAIGKRFGKHKMAPRVSPKKSWEGFAAGLITCMVCWLLLLLVPSLHMSPIQALFFGMISGIMGVIGDLAESRIKRNAGFKDSGTIMPGHGGLLDRTDSMFLASVTSTILLLASGAVPYIF